MALIDCQYLILTVDIKYQYQRSSVNIKYQQSISDIRNSMHTSGIDSMPEVCMLFLMSDINSQYQTSEIACIPLALNQYQSDHLDCQKLTSNL